MTQATPGIDVKTAEAAAPRPDPARRLRNALRVRAMERIYAPNPAPVIYPPRTRFTDLYGCVGSTIGEDAALTYLEFGVWRGASIKRMAAIFTNPEARFVGFDSFEGLPESWGEKPTGTFSMDGEIPRSGDGRISFVKGYFQNTLPGYLASFRPPQGPVLVHFDADLYSSTLFLLTTLWHHFPAYHFIFDEFPGDEAIAMHDFTQAYPVAYTFLAGEESGAGAHEPMRLFGHMKAVTLIPS